MFESLSPSCKYGEVYFPVKTIVFNDNETSPLFFNNKDDLAYGLEIKPLILVIKNNSNIKIHYHKIL